MPAVKERTKKQTRWLIPVIAGAVIVISLVVGIIVHHKKPLTFEDGFVASPTETAVLYDKDGGELAELVRGSAVRFVVEEPREDGRLRILRED